MSMWMPCTPFSFTSMSPRAHRRRSVAVYVRNSSGEMGIRRGMRDMISCVSIGLVQVPSLIHALLYGKVTADPLYPLIRHHDTITGKGPSFTFATASNSLL